MPKSFTVTKITKEIIAQELSLLKKEHQNKLSQKQEALAKNNNLEKKGELLNFCTKLSCKLRITYRLEFILKSISESDLPAALERFLVDTWKIIQHTNLCYTADPDSVDNRLFYLIAHYIVDLKAPAVSEAEQLGTALRLLMPGSNELLNVPGNLNVQSLQNFFRTHIYSERTDTVFSLSSLIEKIKVTNNLNKIRINNIFLNLTPEEIDLPLYYLYFEDVRPAFTHSEEMEHLMILRRKYDEVVKIPCLINSINNLIDYLNESSQEKLGENFEYKAGEAVYTYLHEKLAFYTELDEETKNKFPENTKKALDVFIDQASDINQRIISNDLIDTCLNLNVERIKNAVRVEETKLSTLSDELLGSDNKNHCIPHMNTLKEYADGISQKIKEGTYKGYEPKTGISPEMIRKVIRRINIYQFGEQVLEDDTIIKNLGDVVISAFNRPICTKEIMDTLICIHTIDKQNHLVRCILANYDSKKSGSSKELGEFLSYAFSDSYTVSDAKSLLKKFFDVDQILSEENPSRVKCINTLGDVNDIFFPINLSRIKNYKNTVKSNTESFLLFFYDVIVVPYLETATVEQLINFLLMTSSVIGNEIEDAEFQIIFNKSSPYFLPLIRSKENFLDLYKCLAKKSDKNLFIRSFDPHFFLKTGMLSDLSVDQSSRTLMSQILEDKVTFSSIYTEVRSGEYFLLSTYDHQIYIHNVEVINPEFIWWDSDKNNYFVIKSTQELCHGEYRIFRDDTQNIMLCTVQNKEGKYSQLLRVTLNSLTRDADFEYLDFDNKTGEFILTPVTQGEFILTPVTQVERCYLQCHIGEQYAQILQQIISSQTSNVEKKVCSFPLSRLVVSAAGNRYATPVKPNLLIGNKDPDLPPLSSIREELKQCIDSNEYLRIQNCLLEVFKKNKYEYCRTLHCYSSDDEENEDEINDNFYNGMEAWLSETANLKNGKYGECTAGLATLINTKRAFLKVLLTAEIKNYFPEYKHIVNPSFSSTKQVLETPVFGSNLNASSSKRPNIGISFEIQQEAVLLSDINQDILAIVSNYEEQLIKRGANFFEPSKINKDLKEQITSLRSIQNSNNYELKLGALINIRQNIPADESLMKKQINHIIEKYMGPDSSEKEYAYLKVYAEYENKRKNIHPFLGYRR